MITIKTITTNDSHYPAMRELRNRILLRPIGLKDGAWEMQDEESWHFVALENDRVIGCAVLVPLQDKPKRAQLMQMAVDTNLQGKGVGKLIVTEMVSFASKNKFEEISCHSRDSAVDFYVKLGFEVYGEAFEEVGIPHRHMRIVL
ncbi:GNAT family N-acetyltransferase [Galbibacter sp.]|uniref:GNAT family N-acetyltransferase n=1 Tax=Galbibacter sp. TaxID=2918471 RepID=UPI003A93D901